MCTLAIQGTKWLFRIRLLDECDPSGDQGFLYERMRSLLVQGSRRERVTLIIKQGSTIFSFKAYE
jgi:hypothetical protein